MRWNYKSYIEHLISQGVRAKDIIFLNFDDPSINAGQECNIEDLKHEINERRPVIVLKDPSHIYGGVGGFGHFIVIVGFKDEEIVYHDLDEPDGESMKCDFETFFQAWNATRCWMIKIEKE